MKQQIVFIHGGEPAENYESFEDMLLKKEYDPYEEKGKRRRNFLGKKLGEEYDVLLPAMPNKNYAKYSEWRIMFEKIIPYLQNEVILIGSSLGGTFLSKYLSIEKNIPVKIKALFLVAPAYSDNDLEVLGSFKMKGDFKKLESQVSKKYIYHSKDDFVVPFSDLAIFKEKIPSLRAKEFENYGHFLVEDFPEIVEDIKRL